MERARGACRRRPAPARPGNTAKRLRTRAKRAGSSQQQQRAHQRHASGLMGSPTEPRMRSEERSCCLTQSSPERMSERMAVGAV